MSAQKRRPGEPSDIGALEAEVERLRSELRDARAATGIFPPGHFYSPIPAHDAIVNGTAGNRDGRRPPDDVAEIDLNVTRQLQLLNELRRYVADLPFPEQQRPDCRYWYENDFYSYTDAILLYGMLRYANPRRVIEIGSGYSSAVTLETNDRFFDGRMRCVFVEPYEDRLRRLIRPDDENNVQIIERPVQDVDLDAFRALESGDVLFVDSSHVVKYGSDVGHIFYNVLPVLAAGVYIHFHDIFYPFEYPADWLREGRYWNENYVLRAFLANNVAYRIQLFSDYLARHHRGALERLSPLCVRNTGGSMWLRKTLSST